MKLKLHRKYCKANYTIGNLYLIENDKETWLCNTIEDKVRDLNKDGDLYDAGEGKIYAQTAIPYGTYKVTLTVSPKFKDRDWARPYGGLVPLVNEVKHFTGIRIHIGESEKSSAGCLIVGLNTIKGRLTSTREVYKKLMDAYFMPAHKKREVITLEIV